MFDISSKDRTAIWVFDTECTECGCPMIMRDKLGIACMACNSDQAAVSWFGVRYKYYCAKPVEHCFNGW